jgi:hypothetical protein
VKLIKAMALGACLAAVAAGVGYAAIPSASGVLSACKKADGSIKLIDKESGQGCGGSQQLVEWNVQGPAGPQGPVDPAAAAFIAGFGSDTGGAAGSTTPCTLGEVILSASSRTAGGIPANGQLIAISSNTALFSLLGTTYGGNGETNFALPDLRSITPDHMTYSICDSGAWPQI